MIKKFKLMWKAETPKFWKLVRNAAGAVSAVILTGVPALIGAGLTLPDGLGKVLVYAFLASNAITAYAGTRQVK